MITIDELLAQPDPREVRRLLAPDVAFHSPVADYTGERDVAHLLATIARCVSEVAATHRYSDGARSVSEFTGRVEEHAVDGVLVQHVDAAGRLAEATLLLRPLAGLRRAVALMRDALAAEPLPGRGVPR